MIDFFVRPMETLYFGPPASFSAGEAHRGRGEFPPSPQTFQGLVRSHLLQAADLDLNDWSDHAKRLRASLVGGPDDLPRGWQFTGPFPARPHTAALNQPTAALLGAVYTLTPTHCGTGQTTGPIDLPIARESTTHLPILPASMLKGVAREVCEQQLGRGSTAVRDWFGPDTDESKLSAGNLIFTEGRLLALPVRSLNRAYLYVTSPLLLERFDRDARLFGHPGLNLDDRDRPAPKAGEMQVTGDEFSGKTVVLEDLIYESSAVRSLPQVQRIAEQFANLLPHEEYATRDRLRRNLVVVHDHDLLYLAETSLPVNARIKLSEGKTTGTYRDEDGKYDDGNLWYEETLPSDALFSFFVVWRRDAKASGNRGGNDSAQTLADFGEEARKRPHMQFGGHQTVGQGWCWWTFQ